MTTVAQPLCAVCSPESRSPSHVVNSVDEPAHAARTPAEQAAEIVAAELDSGNVPDQESTTAGILAYALGANGDSLVAGLLQMTDWQLYAVEAAERVGMDTRPLITIVRRLVAAAMELDRRERVGRSAAAKSVQVAAAVS